MIKQGAISIHKSNLKFGKVFVKKLAKEYGTPLLVFSEQQIIDNYKMLESAYKKNYENTRIYYSVKTNYEPQILKTLQSIGANAEIASALEARLAFKAGFTPKQIVIDGPAWTDEDMEYLVSKNIHIFNIDSIDMLHRLNAIAKKKKKKVNVGFRIYPEVKQSIVKTFVENFISKFGIPISDALDAFKLAKELDWVEPIGIHAHIGSMITDPSYYEKSIKRLVELAAEIRNKLEIEIQDINIGGGYGVQSLKYFSLENIILNKTGIKNYKKVPSIDEFAEKITTTFKDEIEANNLHKIDLVLEPGRFVVSNAGVLITKIVSVKKNWIFLDGGTNLIPESLFFIRRGMIVDGKIGKKKIKKYGVAGPTLSTPDIFADNEPFPVVESGDIVVVLDAGAYSLSRSTQFTMLRPAAMYVTKDRKIKYLRKPERHQDFIKKLIA